MKNDIDRLGRRIVYAETMGTIAFLVSVMAVMITLDYPKALIFVPLVIAFLVITIPLGQAIVSLWHLVRSADGQ